MSILYSIKQSRLRISIFTEENLMVIYINIILCSPTIISPSKMSCLIDLAFRTFRRGNLKQTEIIWWN